MQHREYIARLKNFKSDLLQRGRKVLASQNRLTREIHTLLVQQSHQDAKAMQAAISDIKTWCITHRDRFANLAGETLIDIEQKPQVFLPMERPLWSEPVVVNLDFGDVFTTPPTIETAIPLDERAALACWQLEERVNTLLKERASFTLPELMDVYPPEFPLEELVGYLSIGMKNKEHHVAPDDTSPIHEFISPHVTFCSPTQENHHV